MMQKPWQPKSKLSARKFDANAHMYLLYISLYTLNFRLTFDKLANLLAHKQKAKQ